MQIYQIMSCCFSSWLLVCRLFWLSFSVVLLFIHSFLFRGINVFLKKSQERKLIRNWFENAFGSRMSFLLSIELVLYTPNTASSLLAIKTIVNHDHGLTATQESKSHRRHRWQANIISLTWIGNWMSVSDMLVCFTFIHSFEWDVLVV